MYLAVHGLLSSKKSRNQITVYMTYAASAMVVALCLYLSVPTFLVSGKTAGLLVFAGDVFQFLALFWVWVIVIRIFLARQSILRKVSYISAGLLFGICVALSWSANTGYATGVILRNGLLILDFAYPPAYALWSALNFVSILLLGIYFLRESHYAIVASQRWRLRAFASFFMLISIIFVAQPFLLFSFQSILVSVLFAIAFVALGVFSGLALLKQTRQ